jgi:hypothetical protein
MRIVLGILQWTVAIVSVLSTLALLFWIAAMFLRKDRKDESSRDRT